MAVYDRALIVEMECEVCCDYMHPPISQCIIGHSFCNTCLYKLDKCPKCRISLRNTIRNYALEAIYSKMMFHCKNCDDGCPEVGVGGKIRDHQHTCDFVISRCPLYCKWFGPRMDLVHHCKENHPDNIFFSPTQRLVCQDFLQRRTENFKEFYVFNVHERLFKLAWNLNVETGLMRWCVFLIKDGKDCVNFKFSIEIEKRSDLPKCLSLEGPCPVLGPENGVEIFNNHQFVISHVEMMKECCDDGDLVYIVKISKRSHNA